MHFFDSYAFIEIIRGNPNYSRFRESEIATSKLNLMEVYYYILRKFGKEAADKFYDDAVQYSIEIADSEMKNAMFFRLQNKSLNLSYVDCIGYVLARSSGLKFLTGDIQFKDMSNVEFVK